MHYTERADCPCTSIPHPPNPPLDDCADCLTGSQPTIDCISAPNPCGHAGTIVLIKSAVTAAFSVYDYDPIFSNVHFTGDTLYFKINSIGGDGMYRRIRYKLVDAARPGLSFIGEVKVCIKNLCAGILCTASTACDPCTGVCLPILPEASITNNPEITI